MAFPAISKSRFTIILSLLLHAATSMAQSGAGGDYEVTGYEIPYLAGESVPVYPPAPRDSTGRWYINDHCFIVGPGDTLHFFGINNPYPTVQQTYMRKRTFYDVHPYLGHAVSSEPLKTWVRKPWALNDSKGEEYLGAPFVVWLEDERKYVMMLETKLKGVRTMELAWSSDLYRWERTYASVLPSLPPGSRDPCVVRDEEGRYLIYLVTPAATGSTITVTATRDFRRFDSTRVCLTIPDAINYAGAESPFVVRRNGLYYMFVTYAHRHYFETLVYVSKHHDRFSQLITTVYGHAGEIFDWNGRSYITSTGPDGWGPLDTHGLHIAELRWMKP